MEVLIALNAVLFAVAAVVLSSAHLLRVVAAHAAARAVYLDETRAFRREADRRRAATVARELDHEVPPCESSMSAGG